MVDDVRIVLAAGYQTSEVNAHAALVLFALARALRRNDGAAVGKLASTARQVIGGMDAPSQKPKRRPSGKPKGAARRPRPGARDWTSGPRLGVGVDDVTHRRFVVQVMGDMLVAQRHAVERPDPQRTPLSAGFMAQALSRALGSGPLRAFYESQWTPEHDGDAARILGAWKDFVAVDGCIHVDGVASASLARRLVARALGSLGIPPKVTRHGPRAAARGRRGR
jgi:hypothetical protein